MIRTLIIIFVAIVAECFGKVVCIGDSHAERFPLCTEIECTHTRPVPHGDNMIISMYGIAKDRGAGIVATKALEQLQEGDAVLFSFGWIDVNWMFYKQVHEKYRDLDDVVEKLVTNYLDLISTLVDQQVITIVYGVVPPVTGVQSGGYIEDRVEYTQKLNIALANKCRSYGFEFLDIYDDYADARGIMPPEKTDGTHHIHNNCHEIVFNKLLNILNSKK